MILFDRKKALNQIMGPPPDAPMGDHEDVGEHEHLHHLAKEAIDAIHAKDHKGFAEAFHAMHLACGGMVKDEY